MALTLQERKQLIDIVKTRSFTLNERNFLLKRARGEEIPLAEIPIPEEPGVIGAGALIGLEPTVKEEKIQPVTKPEPEKPGLREAFLPSTPPVVPETVGQAGLQVLSGVGDIIDVLRRGVGAAIEKGTVPLLPGVGGRDPGETFLEALADPKTGVFEEARSFIEKSDAPGAVKFLGDFGILLAEDPLTFIGGLIGAGRSGIKNIIKAAKGGPKEIKVAEEIVQQARIPGLKGEPSRVIIITDDVRFTPAEQFKIQGKDLKSPEGRKVLKTEVKLRKSSPQTAKDIEAGRARDISGRANLVREKHGFNDLAVDRLVKEAGENIKSAQSKFRDEASGLYNGIEESAKKLGQVDEKILNDVKNSISEVGIIPKSVDPTTVEEFRQLIKSGGLQTADGKGFRLASQNVTADDLGMTSEVFNFLKRRVTKRLAGDVDFSTLKSVRTELDKINSKILKSPIPANFQDITALREVRKSLTEAMEGWLKKSDPTLADEWKKTDAFFSANVGDLQALEKVFHTSTGTLRTPTQIVKMLDLQSPSKKGLLISRMKQFLPPENFKQFQNLFFNDIIKKSSIGGEVKVGNLIETLNSMPPTVYNEVFTQGMADDIADLLKDFIANKMVKELDLIDRNPKAFTKAVQNKMGRAGSFIAFRTGGITTFLASEAGRTLFINFLKRTTSKKSDRLLRQVDEAALIPAIVGGGLKGVIKIEAPAAVLRDIEPPVEQETELLPPTPGTP